MRQPSALVVGLGSIGARHARLLAEIGGRVAAVSARRDDEVADLPVYAGLEEGLAGWRPDYVVIANSTVRHAATLCSLAAAGYAGLVLVEKPLFALPAPLPDHRFAGLYVGYNLRFHPVLRALAGRLEGARALTAQIYVGSYLPDWRPGRDYRRTASASAAEGGGALRDLSHELDYAGWLFGRPTGVAAMGGRVGGLEIDTDDAFGLLLETPGCPVVTVQMNYLDRRHVRQVSVVTDAGTLVADVVAGTLADGEAVVEFACGRDDTYRAMHRAVLTGQGGDACTAAEGLGVVDLIAAAERAAATRTWAAP